MSPQSHLKLVRAAASHEARDSRGPLTDAEIAKEVQRRASAIKLTWAIARYEAAKRHAAETVLAAIEEQERMRATGYEGCYCGATPRPPCGWCVP
jgi:hypothetical protein